jgi:hypothetical protein
VLIQLCQGHKVPQVRQVPLALILQFPARKGQRAHRVQLEFRVIH